MDADIYLHNYPQGGGGGANNANKPDYHAMEYRHKKAQLKDAAHF